MAKKQTDNFRVNLIEIVRMEPHGSVSRLAEHCGYHRVTMSRKVHGHDPIELEEAEKIAAFYGFNLSDLLVSPKEFKKNLAEA